VERDVEQAVISQLRVERRVLIVGPSMSGKTRLALSAAKAAVGDYVLYQPADGKSIREHLASGARFERVLVWLDDLEQFLGSGGLTDGELTSLCTSPTVAVIATVRSSAYDTLQPTSDIKPPGWEVPNWFGEPIWLNLWTGETARTPLSTPD
jgi:hypothetical protein